MSSRNCFSWRPNTAYLPPLAEAKNGLSFRMACQRSRCEISRSSGVENDLVIATFGRGFYVLDDYTPLRQLEPGMFKDKAFHLFDIKDAKQFPVTDVLGGKRGFQGSGFYTADNPPYGVTWTYFNRDEFKSAKSKRQEAETAARKAKKEVPYPTLDELAAEDLETAPKLVFTIRDSSKNVVHRLTAKDSKGLAKMTWNLRNQDGRQVLPGKYSVSVDRVDGGEAVKLAEPKQFRVVSYVNSSLPAGNRAQDLAYYEQLRDFRKKYQRASNGLKNAKEMLDKVETAIGKSDEPHYPLVKELGTLRESYSDLERRMFGSSDGRRIGVESPLTISQRLMGAGTFSSSFSSPTQTQRDSLKIAQTMYAELQPDLRPVCRCHGKKVR